MVLSLPQLEVDLVGGGDRADGVGKLHAGDGGIDGHCNVVPASRVHHGAAPCLSHHSDPPCPLYHDAPISSCSVMAIVT